MSKIRTKAKRIVVYNHKGGVGKTIITANIAMALAEKGKKVMLVDSDPQSNITIYFYPEEYVNKLFDESDSAKGNTIWSAVKPLVENNGDFRTIKAKQLYKPNLFLLPGDILLSEFENNLNDFWRDCLDGKAKGYNGSTVLSRLINEISQELNLDYIFYDTGPNIGPLNRIILLDCDYLIIPVALDLFSIRALTTLGYSLKKWVKRWQLLSKLAPDNTYLLPGRPDLIGYIPQRFRVWGDRMAGPSIFKVPSIEKSIRERIILVMSEFDTKDFKFGKNFKNLGEIQDFAGLVVKALDKGEALWDVDGYDNQRLKDKAKLVFYKLAEEILRLK